MESFSESESSITISVWFVCKLCQNTFSTVENFLFHKKQVHFTEFQSQNTSCIVFEERVDLGDGPPQSVTIKEEEDQQPEFILGTISNENEEMSDNAMIDYEEGDPVEVVEVEVKPKSELIIFEEAPEFNFQEKTPYVKLNLEQLPPKKSKVSTKTLKHRKKQQLSSPFRSNLQKIHKDPPNSSKIEPNYLRCIFECKLCSKKYNSEPQLQIHIGVCSLYHEDRDRYCVPCNKLFFTADNLRKHNLSCHDEDEGDDDDDDDGRSGKIKNNVESNERDTAAPYKCEICSCSYSKLDTLRLHLRSHSEDRPYKCPVENCDKAYKISSHLSDHMKASHSNSLNPFKCPKTNCGLSFSSRTYLSKHMSTHSDLRPLKCPYEFCEKSFKYHTYYDAHLKTHSGELPFKCMVFNCGKSFSTASWFYSHQKIVHHIQQ